METLSLFPNSLHPNFLFMARIKTALYSSLPGEKAHNIMAPRPKFIEGYEGIHSAPPIKSAVMILITPDENELAVPFIKRVNRGRYHAGQIALPGGKKEESDLNSIETALRECYEEIGVPPEDISILGILSDIYIPLSNYTISPVVGTVLKKPEFVLSPDEVEQIILVKMSELFNAAHKTTASFSRHAHEIVAPGYRIGEHFIWGATAMIISEMEQILKDNTRTLHITPVSPKTGRKTGDNRP